MPATIILADHTGRLGNRLILYAHVMAAAEEYGCRVVNLSILAASHYFSGLHLNPWASYPRQAFPFDLRWPDSPPPHSDPELGPRSAGQIAGKEPLAHRPGHGKSPNLPPRFSGIRQPYPVLALDYSVGISFPLP